MLTPDTISGYVYDNFRSYKKDRCAIFTNYDDITPLIANPSLSADPLQPDENFRWTGTKMSLRRKQKRVIVGDYLDWFCWYMQWQRFNAFGLLLLIKPIGRMLQDEKRGFIDGLLTRLVNKPAVNRVIIIEEERFRPIIAGWMLDDSAVESPELAQRFGSAGLKEAIISLLCGSTLARNRLVLEARRTLSSKLNNDSKLLLQNVDHTYFIDRKHRWFRSLSEEGEAAVQSLSIVIDREHPPEKQFELSKRREHARSEGTWLELVVETHLLNTGWFTIPELYNFVNNTMQRISNNESPPSFLDSDIDSDYRVPNKVFLPSEPILRRIVERMVAGGKLSKTKWFKELGRPTTVYYGQERPPFKEGARCGQCAFYIALRRQCRLWWLLGKAFGPRDTRWDSRGNHPLTAFELYKMKNAWRISPHSSACMKFVDKKKDYLLKKIPETCDICGQSLPSTRENLLVCGNCRTRYYKAKRAVRVLTGYEDQFQKKYFELAGRKPSSDLTRLREEQLTSTFRTLERIDFEKHRVSPEDGDPQPITLMLFPGDRMLTREGQLFLLGRRRVESVPLAGTTIIDHGVLEDEQIAQLQADGAIVRSVVKSIEVQAAPETKHYLGSLVRKASSANPNFARSLALAMAKSAIHATERLDSIAKNPVDQVAFLVQEQLRFLRRMEHVQANRFLVHEALIMKRYWTRYELGLKLSGQRFGPRTKSRFVREHVTSPTGRAKGYSAVDSAINYLHQRRLFKMMRINSQLGISSSGEGVLHFKRWNARGLGLILDLADPLKFADREKLLESVLNYGVNWRDFHTATDRQGMTFYYPKSEIIGMLEKVSDQADYMTVEYGGREQRLSDAYTSMVSNLASFLEGENSSFEPFVF